LIVLRAEPPEQTLVVLKERCDWVLNVQTDVTRPLAPRQWLTDPPINGRLKSLQSYIRFTKNNVSCLILPTYAWVYFNRDNDKRGSRAKQDHLSEVRNHLAQFDLVAASITSVFIPVNTGHKTSNGLHWKGLYLNIDDGSISDLDSMYSNKHYGLYRQFVTDIYTELRPAGSARVHTAQKHSKAFNYTTILPPIKRMNPTAPQQTNDFDCGMFMTAGFESMALRGILDFHQTDMVSLRQQLEVQFARYPRVPVTVPLEPASQIPKNKAPDSDDEDIEDEGEEEGSEKGVLPEEDEEPEEVTLHTATLLPIPIALFLKLNQKKTVETHPLKLNSFFLVETQPFFNHEKHVR
jgi:hypothetical protein